MDFDPFPWSGIELHTCTISTPYYLLYVFPMFFNDLLSQCEKPKIAEEKRERGNVNRSVYSEYFQVGNNILVLVVLGIAMTISYFFFILSDWWIAKW